MAAFIDLRNEIESILTAMADTTYLRALPTEANIALNTLEATNCIALHIDLTSSTTQIYNPNNIVKVIPIEIFFVYKNTELDEKLHDVDTLINNAEVKADEFNDRLLQSQIIEDTVPWPEAEYQRLEAYKKFDAILSGIQYNTPVPVRRNVYTCI